MTGDERRPLSEKLGKGIEEYLEGQGFRGVLGDWLLVGCTVRIDEEGDADAEYFVGMSGGSMLQHHALGLLAKAEDVLEEVPNDD